MLYSYVTLKLNRSIIPIRLKIIIKRHKLKCQAVAIEGEFVVVKAALNEYVRDFITILRTNYSVESTIYGCYMASEYLGFSKED